MSCFRALSPLALAKPLFAKPLFRRLSPSAKVASAALALAALSFSTSACSEAPQAGDCERLLMHLVDVEVNSGSADKDKQAKHKVDLSNGARESFVERCNNDLKASQVTCALKAGSSKELDDCDS